MHTVYAIPGFLGRQSDWAGLSREITPIKVIPAALKSPPQTDFWAWAANFNRSIETENKTNIILGYSLGGRLAMHALLNAPEKWSAAIFVSCHPGLNCPYEKQQRYAEDCAWGGRFLHENWDSLMHGWNQRGALASSPSISRLEKDYCRKELSRQLKNWSLGSQEELSDRLASLNKPILWMAGEQDTRFAKIVQEMPLAGYHSKIWIAPNSGHRLPWDAPKEFAAKVAQFINSLKARCSNGIHLVDG